MIKERYLTTPVVEDLKDKMVFVGGPRQVGKTTLAKSLVGTHFREAAYFNWDKRQDRRQVTAAQWPGSADLIILDEIHKFKRWKRFIKGEYDTLKNRYKFLITGSARLDVYRKGGDSDGQVSLLCLTSLLAGRNDPCEKLGQAFSRA